jgi:hypothetical protein
MELNDTLFDEIMQSLTNSEMKYVMALMKAGYSKLDIINELLAYKQKLSFNENFIINTLDDLKTYIKRYNVERLKAMVDELIFEYENGMLDVKSVKEQIDFIRSILNERGISNGYIESNLNYLEGKLSKENIDINDIFAEIEEAETFEELRNIQAEVEDLIVKSGYKANVILDKIEERKNQLIEIIKDECYAVISDFENGVISTEEAVSLINQIGEKYGINTETYIKEIYLIQDRKGDEFYETISNIVDDYSYGELTKDEALTIIEETDANIEQAEGLKQLASETIEDIETDKVETSGSLFSSLIGGLKRMFKKILPF